MLARGRAIIEQALEGGRALTRAELAASLAKKRITVAGQPLAHMVMHAELEGAICSGPRRGGKFTYALLEERAPRATSLSRDEPLAALALRFFRSHGPATIRDYAWWSGLTVKDARAGVAMVTPALRRQETGGLTYFSTDPAPRAGRRGLAHLLPIYDEYLVAYKDRGLVADARNGRDLFWNHVVIGGVLAATWTRAMDGDTLRIEIAPYGTPSPVERAANAQAAERHRLFSGCHDVGLTYLKR